MLRKTLTILSLIGLLLSVGLWGVSYCPFLYFGNRFLLGMSRGNVRLKPIENSEFDSGKVRVLLKEDEGTEIYYYEVDEGKRWKSFAFSGFNTSWRPDKNFGLPGRLSVPLWMPSIAFGLTLLACRPLHFHRRRKRKKLGLCLKCGYDLRASKDRCPECGEEFGSTGVAR